MISYPTIKDHRLKKKVFISYSFKDLNKVNTLLRKIKATDFLEPIVVEYNRNSMLNLSDKIESYFKKVDLMIPILTSRSIYTQYINQEIGYAQAKKIQIYPLVEQEVMSKLKGFITNQRDLPYNFKAYPNRAKEGQAFRNSCDILLEDVARKVRETKQREKPNVGLSHIFKGIWINHYALPNGHRDSERVEIRNGNRYYVGHNFMFKLDKIFISKDKKRIRFRKNGVNGDGRTARNILELERPGVYIGNEEGNKVRYSKLY